MNIRIVTADRVPWEDLDAVFGPGNPHGSNWASNNCRCQRFKVPGWMWRDSTLAERLAAQRAQARGGSGLVAYVDDEPAGWVAVEPRVAYPKLLTTRAPWTGRNEDRHDPDVWAVTCFVVRKGYRGRGLTYRLAEAAAEHARACGAKAVEGYSMLTRPGKVITWGELHVGAKQVFEEAGFREVHQPSARRVVMRKDF
ncbi:N-acetyltransferase GCN5 [Virgisporangium aliadipatigenens]|uniref:N-acetyltransferase GCN5 n=1 Tax=Virgisporangium aliadipatigenens TaxID=741659 RepID=A0A8J3YLL7_9ACTN|nr:GNAT family N-acetyltransferase [Virgisporangium aliadipatigenens]GIJ46667.1 N-acetyltransferase GCN5 [Virgisporangium aliadipatigenens]